MNDKFLDQIVVTQVKILDKLTEVEKTQVIHNEVLKDHTRRSLANEEQTHMLREQLEPIKKHVTQVEVTLKVIGGICVGISGTVGVVMGVIKLLELF